MRLELKRRLLSWIEIDWEGFGCTAAYLNLHRVNVILDEIYRPALMAQLNNTGWNNLLKGLDD